SKTVRRDAARLQTDRLVKILDRLVVFLLGGVDHAAVDITGGIVGLGLDRIAKGLDCFLHFPGAFICQPKIVVVIGLARVSPDRFLKKTDRFIPFLLFGGLDAVLAKLVGIGFRVGQRDRG